MGNSDAGCEALNSGKESDGKKLFCGGTEQYIFSSPNRAQRGFSKEFFGITSN